MTAGSGRTVFFRVTEERLDHFEELHGGRIRAAGPASSIAWSLGGRDPLLRVDGRERRDGRADG